MAAIEVENLVKHYGAVEAVRGISFRVQEGEVFALLGPNGAGKTTTLEILEGHRRRSDGQVSVLGIDPELGGERFRDRIGVVLQSAGIDRELTVAEAVQLYAGCYSRALPVAEVIALVGLEEKGRSRVGTLSGGQLRRLDLALALVGDPDLIFLDEPTTGFDPEARHSAWRLIEQFRGLGRTIVLTSHYMDEVQHLADRAIVIAQGRVVAEGEPDALGGHRGDEATIAFRLADAGLVHRLPSELVDGIEWRAGELILRTTEPTSALLSLCRWAVEEDIELHGLQVTRPSLEEVYLQLTREGGDGHR